MFTSDLFEVISIKIDESSVTPTAAAVLRDCVHYADSSRESLQPESPTAPAPTNRETESPYEPVWQLDFGIASRQRKLRSSPLSVPRDLQPQSENHRSKSPDEPQGERASVAESADNCEIQSVLADAVADAKQAEHDLQLSTEQVVELERRVNQFEATHAN